MLGQDIQPFIVLIVIGIAFLLIYRNVLQAGLALLLSVMSFMILGILSPQEVLAGFSNDKIASILLLILLAAGVRKNFQIEKLFDRVFERAKTYRRFLLQLMAQSAVLSSFINNAPVVALLTPYVVEWGKKNNISPSKLLIPLSFATITGGMLTVIGTSTTLLLNGFLTSVNQSNIATTTLLIPGAAVVLTAMIFFLLIGHSLLPNHKDLLDTFQSNRKDFLIEARLIPGSRLVGKQITDAGLRHIQGGYLVEIVRSNQIIYPIQPDLQIEEKDIFIFAGQRDNLIKFVENNADLSFPKHSSDFIAETEKVKIVECVIDGRSSLIGSRVRDINFRERYDAGIVAIQRHGERLAGKIGDMKIKAGDLLLVFAGKSFDERVDLYRDIHSISRNTKIARPKGKKIRMALLSITAAIAFLILYGEIGLFASLLIIFSIMVAFRLITMTDIKRELDLNLVTILVFSLALGTAMINTGAGTMVADSILSILSPFGNLGILLGIILIATVLTSIIGNVGAVSITFPLAYAVVSSLGVDGMPFYLGLAFGASAAFITPISYQTNLIVFGPGGYTFRDFLKVGVPMTIIYLSSATLVILWIYSDFFLSY